MEHSGKHFCTQLSALLTKNFLLKKRALWTTIAEIVIPFLFILLLVAVRKAVDIDKADATVYNASDLSGTLVYGLSSLMQWIVLSGHHIALVPGREDPAVDAFVNFCVNNVNLSFFGVSLNSSSPSSPPQYGSYGYAPMPELTDFFFTEDMFVYFNTNEELTAYMKDVRYPTSAFPPIEFAVVFTETGPLNWQYMLRMNSSVDSTGPMTQRVPDFVYEYPDTTNDLQRIPDLTTAILYSVNGFMSMQVVVDEFILVSIAQSSNQPYSRTPYTTSMLFPTEAYNIDLFAELIGGFLGLIYTFAYTWPVTRVVKLIVDEKETKVSEGLQIMGLGRISLWLSWMITYSFFFLLTAFLITISTTPTVFPNTSPGIIFLTFWLFGVSCFACAYCISACFSKAKTAVTAAACIFLLGFFGYYSFDVTSSKSSMDLGCLHPSICLAFGATTISRFEATQTELNYANIGTEIDGFSVQQMLNNLVRNIFVFILLGTYLSLTLPQEYGRPYPWYFCCLRSFYVDQGFLLPEPKAKADKQEVELVPDEFIEPLSEDLLAKVAIKVRNLSKVFNEGVKGQETKAVDRLHLDVVEGQILALLGHNGAGKSTTIHMLTGLYPPSSGEAQVLGYSVTGQMDKIRSNMGFCPQHDILLADLSVAEHLTMLAKLKNTTGDVPSLVLEMANQIDLGGKLHSLSKDLSGGMKRKLCLGMALIGDSKVVILDEPTSGMDPMARAKMWELLRSKKQGRCIILTTHFMDEADALGDRITIMAKGKVRCSGSSLFLKSKFGVGYSLTISQKPEAKTSSFPQVTAMVTGSIASAKVLSQAGGELSFQLPLQAAADFPVLFDALDAKMEALSLEAYGISVTTLEEVFLRVAHEHDDAEKDVKTLLAEKDKRSEARDFKLEMEKAVGEGEGVTDGLLKREFFAKEHDKQSNWAWFENHFRALILKRRSISLRDTKAMTWLSLYPFLLLLAGVGLQTASTLVDPAPIALTAEAQFSAPVPRVAFNLDTFGLNDGFMTPSGANPMHSLAVPDSEAYSDATTVAEYLLESFYSGDLRYGALGFCNLDTLTAILQSGQTPSLHCSFPSWNFNTTPASLLSATILFNSTARDALPMQYNLLDNARAKAYNPDASITISNHPLPATASSVVFNESLISIFIGMAFAFIPATFTAFVVLERETNAKHLQIISGVSVPAYWASTLAWDLMLCVVPSSLCIIVLYVFDVEVLTENIGSFILLVFLYSLSVCNFSYLCSFLFRSHSSAQSTMLIVCIITSTIVLIAYIVMGIIEKTQDINEKLGYIYRLFPPFCFAQAVSTVMVMAALETIYATEYEVFSKDIAGLSATFMIVEAFVYFGLVLLIEYLLSNAKLRTQLKGCFNGFIPSMDFSSTPLPASVQLEDVDVVEERKRVEAGHASSDIVVLKNLAKRYPNGKVAVHPLTFSIPQGQCLGFLGVNGAGKTTTLKMLSLEHDPTGGEAFLNSFSILNQQTEVRRSLGYCPQFDALIPTLTARETLSLYARIKAVPEEMIAEYVTAMIQKLQLQAYADKPCGGYSGGNKRKLSVGIALIGDPSIVFLDEPSSGMDPDARRFMWKLISSTMAGRSVILTTHSMEECEALCGRIAIMAAGRLQCLGSSPHLKHRFGSGYQLDCNLAPARQAELAARVGGELKAVVKRQDGHKVTFGVPKGLLSLGKIFAMMESLKAEFELREYSLSETTLEQIFLQIAENNETREP